MPNFGQIGNYLISNPAKTITKNDLLRGGEDFIKLFVNDKNKTSHPFLEYDEKKHKYKLKPKYDLEKIIKTII